MGVGVSVGAQTGVYVYAEAGYGKGSNHLESTTHNNTTLNADQISIKSQGDTTLKGAQATANRIDADVGGNLNIISQQDTLEQKNKQMGVGARVQVSAGTAWDASGNFNNSSAKGNSKSVNEQSGLFAGEGGYHVKADHVDLKGGAIASTASKENNNLTANSLTFSNIENESSHKATTVALSGGTRFGEETKTDNQGNKYTNNVNWRDSTTFSPSLPQHESDKDSSVTRSTLSEGNITIGGQATTTTALGIHSDASTAHRSVDTLPNLQEIIDKQKTVADATSTIVAATRTYSQNQQKQAEQEKKNTEQTAIAELQAKGGEDWNKYQNSDNEAQKQELLKNNSPSYKQASETAQDWGMGGDKSRAVNAVAMAVTGALGGQTDLQVAANALAPYAANIIGKELGHGEDKNKAAQLAAHAILGAALAYVNGGNPAAGGSAAVASEAAADYLTNRYKDKKEYQDANGEFQPNLLPEDVKTQIRDLTAAIGAVVGGTVGDSAFNAQLSGVVGQNAVENNDFSLPYGNTNWAQGVGPLISDAKNRGLSDEEIQELLQAYKQPDAKQGREYVEGLTRGSVEIAVTTMAPELAIQKLTPIVVTVSKSSWFKGVLDSFKGLFGKGDDSGNLMDSVTAAGDTIRHNSVSTAVGDDAATINNFNNAIDTGKGHNVIVHGSGPKEINGQKVFYDELGGIPIINNKPTNMEQVAEAVRTNPNYIEGTPICLGSCWSGSSGTAQELANSLKAPVFAPSRPTAWDVDAKKWVLDTDKLDMVKHPEIKPEWKMFYPK